MYKDYKPTKTIVKFDADMCKIDGAEEMSLSRRKKFWNEKIKNKEENK